MQVNEKKDIKKVYEVKKEKEYQYKVVKENEQEKVKEGEGVRGLI
jgi:hypothetical protein